MLALVLPIARPPPKGTALLPSPDPISPLPLLGMHSSSPPGSGASIAVVPRRFQGSKVCVWEFSRILPICCVNLHRTHVRRSPRRKGAAAMPPRTTTTKMVPILRFIRHVCAAQRSVDYHHHHTFARCVHGVGKWCDLCTLFGGLRWRGGSGAPMLTLTILLSLSLLEYSSRSY